MIWTLSGEKVSYFFHSAIQICITLCNRLFRTFCVCMCTYEYITNHFLYRGILSCALNQLANTILACEFLSQLFLLGSSFQDHTGNDENTGDETQLCCFLPRCNPVGFISREAAPSMS